MSSTILVPSTMTAAMIVEYGKPLVVRTDVPVPNLTPTKILVRIEATSLCSTDLMAYTGKMERMTKLPYVGGHEPAGLVVKVGERVKGFEVGDRVGFLPSKDACNSCSECDVGNHHYCPSRTIQGFNEQYGGFSEYTMTDPEACVKIPETISFKEAAPLFCAGITAYSALLKISALPGQAVNIIGVGGVGHVAVMYAKAMGYRVIAYDIADDKLAQAKECGADATVNLLKSDLAQCEKAPSTLVISGALAAYDNAVSLTANHGTIVTVGLPPAPWPAPIQLLNARDITLRPTQTGSKKELIECLDLAARKGIKPIIKVQNINRLNDGFQELADGKVEGRLVFTFH